jgi:hypothetical protein
MGSVSATTPATFTENQTSEIYPPGGMFVNSTLMGYNSTQNSSEHTSFLPSIEDSEDTSLQDTIFPIATTLCIAGVMGNLATLLVILLKKRIRVPAYTGIFCLSLADMLGLLIRYFVTFPSVFPMILSFEYIFGVSCFMIFSSYFHVVIIAFIRYIYISKPFYSLTFTYRKVLHLSAGVWITSLAVAILYSVHIYLFQEKYMSLSQSDIVELVTGCLLFLGSIIPVIIFYVLSIVQLRKGLSTSIVSFSKSMSAMLATVIIIFVVTNVPMIVKIILNLSNNHANIEIGMMAQFSLMLNHSANPFLYFLFSATVRKRLLTIGSCCCIRN